MATLMARVAQDATEAAGEGTDVQVKAGKMAFLVVQDFYTQMAIERRGYHVKVGNITTHFTGDVEITDATAEASVDPPLGTTIIPVYLNVHIEALGGTVPIVAAKSVGATATGGDGFIPLPLYMGGGACTSPARADAAGGCTVTAETTLTTRRHYSATLATADMIFEWEPRMPPVLVGPAAFYVQVAGTTTGPNYFANFDFIELPTTAVS